MNYHSEAIKKINAILKQLEIDTCLFVKEVSMYSIDVTYSGNDRTQINKSVRIEMESPADVEWYIK
jgi:hypothetical protein